MTLASSTTRHRVARNGTLVLGGGFAGASVARRLGRAGATIVNPTNFMLYTPLLPEAAAGSVEPRHVVVPLRAMCPDADLLLGSAVALDHERRLAEVESDAGRFSVAYTDLVVALGTVTRMPAVHTTVSVSSRRPSDSTAAPASTASSAVPLTISMPRRESVRAAERASRSGIWPRIRGA